MSQAPRDEGEREVGDPVLECRARAAGEPLHGEIAGVVELRWPATGGGHRRLVEVLPFRSRDEAAAEPVGDHREGRVARHVGRVEVLLAPPRQLPALAEVVEQREQHLAVAVRLDEREELVLGLVGVPGGEVRVLRAPVREVGRAVEAEVAPVDVRERVRVQQRVVERRVERLAVKRVGALHLDRAERLVPRGPGGRTHGVEADAERLGLEVAPRPCEVDEGDADARRDRSARARVEADPCRCVQPVAAQVSVPGEGPVEASDEVDGVAALGGARHLVRPADRHVARLHAGDAAPRVDDHVRLLGRAGTCSAA